MESETVHDARVQSDVSSPVAATRRIRLAGEDLPDQATRLSVWIEENPEYPGPADARVKPYGVPVWALVGQARVTRGGLPQVAQNYDLPLDAVDAAMEYYRAHVSAIDARMAANDLDRISTEATA